MLKHTALAVAAGLLAAVSAHGQLAHRYDLSSVNDSVGTANGTFVNTGGTATLSGGMLTTTGANGTDCITLPASVGTGITGNFSIETWVTQTGATPDYSSLFSFANAQANFVLLNPNRGGNGGTVADLRAPALNSGGEFNLATTGANILLPTGSLHDIVLTYNATSGQVTVFNNGAQVGQGTYAAGFSFAAAANGTSNGINGNGPYGDPTFTGSTTDLRIFSQSLTQAQVTRLDGLGADATNAAITAAIPEPSTWTVALTGVASLLGLQRFRRRAQANA